MTAGECRESNPETHIIARYGVPWQRKMIGYFGRLLLMLLLLLLLLLLLMLLLLLLGPTE